MRTAQPNERNRNPGLPMRLLAHQALRNSWMRRWEPWRDRSVEQSDRYDLEVECCSRGMPSWPSSSQTMSLQSLACNRSLEPELCASSGASSISQTLEPARSAEDNRYAG